jgi:hypothetical protein
MRDRKWLAAIAAAAMSFSGSASAQVDNPYAGGTRLPGPAAAEIPTGPKSPEDKARVATQQFAVCLIKRNRAAVIRAIRQEPWADGAEKMLRSVVEDRCLDSGELAIPTSLMRGAFYQQLYRESYAAAPPALPPAAGDLVVPSEANLSDKARTNIAVRQFGDCVVRSDLTDAHAFLMANPGSAQEDGALNALMPHLGGCLIKGSNWTLNRSSLGAVLSEVLYREGAGSRTAAN